MAKKKYKITYNTGGKTKIIKVNSAKEKAKIVSFLKARKEKDGYRNIRVSEIK